MIGRGLLPAAPFLEIGPGAIERTPRILRSNRLHSGAIMLVSGPGATVAHAARVRDALEADNVAVWSMNRVQGYEDEARDLAARISAAGRRAVVVAVGGGRVIDVAKLAVHTAGARLVTVPTSLAHDGICSPVSSLRDEHGRRQSHAARMPCGVIVDVGVVASAPHGNVLAGIGDLLSNITATLDWKLSARHGHERYNAVAGALAVKAARPALRGGPLDSPTFLTDLARGLVDSGMAMAIAGSSRPCSGGEHLISHSLDSMLGHQAEQHGLQVALGTLVSAAVHGRHLRQLHNRFLEVGLPRHPHELGISVEDFIQAVINAPATRPERKTFLDTISLTHRNVQDLLDMAFVRPEVPQAS